MIRKIFFLPKIFLGLDMDSWEEHIRRNYHIFRACCFACLSFGDCVTEIFWNVTARCVRFADVHVSNQVDRFLWFLWRLRPLPLFLLGVLALRQVPRLFPRFTVFLPGLTKIAHFISYIRLWREVFIQHLDRRGIITVVASIWQGIKYLVNLWTCIMK